MNQLKQALWAEGLKIYRSKVFWFSILFFVFVTLMIGLLMFVQIHPEISAKLGLIGTKASMLRIGEPDWQNYLTLLSQAAAAIEFIGFGFVITWIIGREYSDKTIKDILALPLSRSIIVLSKFLAAALWCILLSIIFYVFAFITGKLTGISGWSDPVFLKFSGTYIVISVLTILLCTPVAFFACFGRGYLLPFSFIILIMMLANFAGFVGWGPFFPWAIPGILSLPPSDNIHLNSISYFIVAITSIIGYAVTLTWWYIADHK